MENYLTLATELCCLRKMKAVTVIDVVCCGLSRFCFCIGFQIASLLFGLFVYSHEFWCASLALFC